MLKSTVGECQSKRSNTTIVLSSFYFEAATEEVKAKESPSSNSKSSALRRRRGRARMGRSRNRKSKKA